MSDRLKYPVECAGCGLPTHNPTMCRYAEPFCHECKDRYNANDKYSQRLPELVAGAVAMDKIMGDS